MTCTTGLPGSLRGGWRVLAVLVTVLILAGALPGSVERAHAQDDRSFVWDRYDVAIDVQSDGTMHITEYQVITFDGRFRAGTASIPLSNVEDIDNVTVSVANSEGEEPDPYTYESASAYDENPGTFSTWIESGELVIDYSFDPTSSTGTSTRVVVIEYDVEGGIRVYEDLDPANQQVWWFPITYEVTDLAPVRESTATITLPEAVPLDQTVVFPDDPLPMVDGAPYPDDPSGVEATAFSWSTSNLDAGEEFEISLQFPPITAAEVPDWQAEDDALREEREEAEERSAWAGFLLMIAGLLALFGGGVAILGLWFTRGRDPEVGLVAEYTETPPDDLRPGAVGTLLDETFHSRDVVATVLDLAHRGVIRMDPVEGPGMSTQYKFTLSEHQETLRDYEQTVLDVIFGAGAKPGAEKHMPVVAGSLASSNDEIAAGYYQELVEHKYVPESPEKTRDRWRRVFKVVPFLIAAAVIGIVVVAGAWSNWAFLPIAVGLAFMVTSGGLANAMPKKTLAGTESAATWLAFRKYLEDIEDRTDLAESKEIFEKYLPYAVAFGLAEEWVQKFAYVRTPSPEWYGGAGPLFGGGDVVIIGDGPGRRRRRSYPGQQGGWTTISGDPSMPHGGGSGPGGDFDIPSLQDLSDRGAGGLQSGSDSFFDMLGTVAKAFAESSGGGSGSFGSGGGFGGFSGGGSRGGGSRGGGGGGGGRRGFR